MAFAIILRPILDYTPWMRRYLTVFLCLLFSNASLGAISSQQLQLLIEQKQFAEAARNGAQMLREDSADTQTRFLTAYALQMSGETDAAAALYEELIRDNPELPEPRNNLAMIYLAKGDYDIASQLLVDAINTHSSYATAYANLSRVYKGIASEAYRRAVSESSEPAKYTHDIQLTAITSLDSPPLQPAVSQVASAPQPEPAAAPEATPELAPKAEAVAAITAQPAVDAANPQTLLIETVRDWATAWQGKDFDAYTEAYRSDYRARFATHDEWVKHRFGRVMRPGTLQVKVSEFDVKMRGDLRASVDFVQAYSSPGYSDKVVKRLDFEKVGSQWKITSERVLSVL